MPAKAVLCSRKAAQLSPFEVPFLPGCPGSTDFAQQPETDTIPSPIFEQFATQASIIRSTEPSPAALNFSLDGGPSQFWLDKALDPSYRHAQLQSLQSPHHTEWQQSPQADQPLSLLSSSLGFRRTPAPGGTVKDRLQAIMAAHKVEFKDIRGHQQEYQRKGVAQMVFRDLDV